MDGTARGGEKDFFFVGGGTPPNKLLDQVCVCGGFSSIESESDFLGFWSGGGGAPREKKMTI